MAQARNGSNEKLLVRTGQTGLNQTIHNKSYIINKIWENIFCGYVQLDTIQEYSFSFFVHGKLQSTVCWKAGEGLQHYLQYIKVEYKNNSNYSYGQDTF